MLQKPRLRREQPAGARVLCQAFPHVMPEILEHVPDSIGDFAKRRQDVGMIAIGEYLAAAAREAIERARESYCEPLHRPRQRFGAFSLDYEMQVVALDGIVDDANAESLLRLIQGILDRALSRIAAQISDVGQQPHRQVHRIARRKLGPLQVRDPRLVSVGFAAGAFALPTPGPEFERLQAHRDLDLAYNTTCG